MLPESPSEGEPLSAAELPAALALAMAPPGGRHANRNSGLSAFTEYLGRPDIRWTGRISRRGGQTTGLAIAVLAPGGSALILLASPGRGLAEHEVQVAVTSALLCELRTGGLRFAQVLLEPADAARRAVAQACGFAPLAELDYLQRSPLYPWVDEPRAAEGSWIHYGAGRHEQFVRAVADSYVGSRDCPALSDVRPADDALAAHRATGIFDPSLWEIALVDGVPSGVLLLNGVVEASALEVVYMGVAAQRRRHGIGSLLLRRALQQARQRRAGALTIVVDRSNEPASRLYARFGFQSIARREALWLCWANRPRAAEPAPTANRER